MDTKVTLDWLNDVFTEAATESKAGKFGKLNALTKSPALQFYYINVHKMHTVSPEQFAVQYVSYIDEAEQIRKQATALDEAQQAKERLDNLESKVTAELEKLPDMIKAALAEAMAQNTPKPVKKSKAKVQEDVEPEAEPEADAEDAAESEA